MPINKKYRVKFFPNFSYHVYNRTNAQELLFITDKDRLMFLSMMKYYLFPYFNIHCYCLLDNHFHLLVSTKSFCELLENLQKVPKKNLCITESRFMHLPIEEKLINVHTVYKTQFSRLFLAYSNYFNKEYSRKGNLFNRQFKRIVVLNDLYFQKLVLYIHQNPVKHALTTDFENYEWSSFKEYDGQMRFINNRSAVLGIFEGYSNYQLAHINSFEYKLIANLLLE